MVEAESAIGATGGKITKGRGDAGTATDFSSGAGKGETGVGLLKIFCERAKTSRLSMSPATASNSPGLSSAQPFGAGSGSGSSAKRASTEDLSPVDGELSLSGGGVRRALRGGSGDAFAGSGGGLPWVGNAEEVSPSVLSAGGEPTGAPLKVGQRDAADCGGAFASRPPAPGCASLPPSTGLTDTGTGFT